MPHSPEDKKRAVTRLRRIRGQADALEAAVMDGAECGAVLQQLAALRGAVNGLMSDVLESHLRDTLGAVPDGDAPAASREATVAELVSLVRSYLK